ncbi:hypothetical protein ACWD7M_16910 [Streptomyces griseus]
MTFFARLTRDNGHPDQLSWTNPEGRTHYLSHAETDAVCEGKPFRAFAMDGWWVASEEGGEPSLRSATRDELFEAGHTGGEATDCFTCRLVTVYPGPIICPVGLRKGIPQLASEQPVPTRFISIPSEITAVQLRWSRWSQICELLGDALMAENPLGAQEIPASDAADTCGEPGPGYIALKVRTANDEVATVHHGAWIIPEAQPGRFYPCQPDVFVNKYRPATPVRPPVCPSCKTDNPASGCRG